MIRPRRSVLWVLRVLSVAFFVALCGERGSYAATFVWSGPAECPTEAVVRARVVRDLGTDLDALPDVDLEARTTRVSHGYRLELVARRGRSSHERRIAAATCAELVDVLVAALSLALDALAPKVEGSGLADAWANRGDAGPSDVRAGAVVDEADAGSLRSGTPVAESPVNGVGDGDVVLGPKQRSASDAQALAGLYGFTDVGTLPGAAFGMEAVVGAQVGVLQMSLLGALIPKQRFDLDSGTTGEFDLYFGGARFCYSSRERRWGLRGCGVAEVGRLRGEGRENVSHPRSGHVLWVTAGPEAEIWAHPTRAGWRVVIGGGLPFPLNRRTFALTNVGDVHTPASPALRFGLGVEVQVQ